MKKVFIIILFLSLIGQLAFQHIKEKHSLVNAISLSQLDLSNLDDGIYKGAYQTNMIAVQVAVTLKSSQIVDIEILEHNHGKGKKAERILSAIIASNSLQVDTISGATSSSKVILKAVEKALVK